MAESMAELRPALRQILTVLGNMRAPSDARVVVISAENDVHILQELLADTEGPVLVLVDLGLPWRRTRLGAANVHSLCRRIRDLCNRQDRETRAAYVLWPSATNPRFAVPLDGGRAFAWLRRSGVLGGGSRAVTRLLARQRMVNRILWWSSPGAFLVVEPR
jgi:hypothetical protein